MYDDASPTIRGNSIYSVARIGVSAGGDTHATVTGNLIGGCGMAGMGCWVGSRDEVVQNTFTNNARAGVEVTGDASPSIERNIFYYQPVAVACYAYGAKDDKGGGGETIGHPKLVGNWVWPDPKASMPLQPGVDATTHVGEIRFMDNNYTLPPDAPARAAHVGAADHSVATGSPFPLQKEERAIMPEKADWDYQLWKKG